uniref:Uncharacterized protein n=1 Tax=Rhizophora mucronata TaxID=61149 RepID=A0A2P2QBG1_RHIMU
MFRKHNWIMSFKNSSYRIKR